MFEYFLLAGGLFILVGLHLQWRNNLTLKTFRKWLDIVADQNKKELAEGNFKDWVERFRRFETISYDKVCFTLWRDPDSFFDREFLMLPPEEKK